MHTLADFNKLNIYLDCARSPVLEADAVEPLVEVDGVLAGHYLAHGGGLVALAGRHLVLV